MGGIESCCQEQKDDMLLVTKMDLSHCGCTEVPNVVFHAERCIETLILASNQISSLPPQLFHCQELKHLNLIDNCISSIPPAIGSLVHLVSLKLDKNNLKDLPENLKCCRKLKRLSLNNNLWRQVPSIATHIISLEEIYMNDCELSFLPASIGRLTKLKILELRNNNLCNLPLSMTRLTSLTRLDIGDNEFTQFPTCVNSLKGLSELLIDNNDIEEISDIKNLVNLEHFDASYNHISVINDSIGNCSNLNMFNLSFNYLEQLPDTIGNIEKLQTLHLEMNELTEIPETIGKLRNLEDLNICNNRLYTIPISIGLLRNLRNFNVSRNTIEEFPPEIGSCTKLTVINAGYNRLQVLPSEIGYLNNLKVLDLVGNFLMYLPISIINLRNIRAIWLSANQNVPLIPFTEDLNIASGERFLTNIALPQLGEIPVYNNQNTPEDKEVVNGKSSSWGKKIRFAEDDDILPGKLHRTPTPFPKELRTPNRKQHIRNEETKNNDNYVNVFDGKPCESELQPPTNPITKNGSGLLNFTESCVTMIREANIRRNNKNHGSENEVKGNCSKATTENCGTTPPEDSNTIRLPTDDTLSLSSNPINNCKDVTLEDESQFNRGSDVNINRINFPTYCNNFKNPNVGQQASVKLTECFEKGKVNDPNCQFYESEMKSSQPNENSAYCTSDKNIYSNISSNNHNDTVFCKLSSSVGFNGVDHEKSIQMYNKISVPEMDFIPCGDVYKEQEENFASTAPPNVAPRLTTESFPYSDRRLTETPMHSATSGQNKIYHGHPYSKNEIERSISKQDMMILTERMRSKNLSPPCYEIAKMYSTKAALFEQNRIENCK